MEIRWKGNYWKVSFRQKWRNLLKFVLYITNEHQRRTAHMVLDVEWMRTCSLLAYLSCSLGQETAKRQLRSSSPVPFVTTIQTTLPGLGSGCLSVEFARSRPPHRHSGPTFGFKGARWNKFRVFVADCLLSLIEGRGVFAARFPPLESGQGLRFLRSSWPSPLGRGSAGEEAVFAVGDRRRAHSEAHRSETYRFEYVEATKRVSSVISGATTET